MRASLKAMALARGITTTRVVPMNMNDPAVIIGRIAVVMEPGCYQVFRYGDGILNAVGEPHDNFNGAATTALDLFEATA